MRNSAVRPEPLDAAVSRAAALRNRLIAQEGSDEPWFVGRAGELDALVVAVLTDWRSGALDTAAAVDQLTKYSDEIERGINMATTFGLLRRLASADDTASARVASRAPKHADAPPLTPRATSLSRFDTSEGEDVDPWSLQSPSRSPGKDER